MVRVELEKSDVEAFCASFWDIVDNDISIEQDDDDLRQVIANLVGAFRSQVSVDTLIRAKNVKPRVSVERVLEDKFDDWNEDFKVDPSIPSPARVLYDALDLRDLNAYLFSLGDNDEYMAAIENFIEALDHPIAIQKYQVWLSLMSDAEIRSLSLAAVADGVCSCVY